jgi:hypothetical protein
LFRNNKLRQVTGAEAILVKKNVLGSAPSWFAPREATEYEVWVFDDESSSNFRLLIDKTSRVMFIADYQV